MTRLTKERQMISKMQSKNTKISFASDNKTIEVICTAFGTQITYYISLPERYPFLSPKIAVDIPQSLTSLYAFSPNLLDDIYPEPWTPSINLQNIIEELVVFTQQSLAPKQSRSMSGLGRLGVLLVCLVVRSALFSQGYSGFDNPPLYGDYEAQRHWMELTVNFQSEMWYRNTSETDPSYWKLDYPPLTAWHSYVCGLICYYLEPGAVELETSRGYQSSTSMVFMRGSVMVSELVVLIPAVIVFFAVFYKKIQPDIRNFAVLLILISPQMLLIDYGHFQYNNVMLGFMLIAFSLAVTEFCALSAIFLALSVNFKIMALYYSLPFLVYWMISLYDLSKKESYRYSQNARNIIKIGTFFSNISSIAGFGITTCVILWYPWLSYEDFFQVLQRIFPFQRGVFEDKVATFWCIASTVIKFKEYFSVAAMSLMTGLTTLLASLPFLYLLVVKRQRNQGFLYCLSGVSLSFFLFSYHVHENTILVPLLPISLLTVFSHPHIFQLAVIISTFSMYPLLVIDKLILPYFVLQMIFYGLSQVHINNLSFWVQHRQVNWWYAGMILVHCLQFMPMPENLPYLYNLVVAAYSFAVFCYIWVFLLRNFWDLDETSSIVQRLNKEKTR